MLQNSLFEKLEISNQKNFLIQGLPSSIEKQFIKLSYSKNVTPLLKTKKIDFALVFAINGNQLNGILKEVLPNLSSEAKLWVAYPKSTSKIASDLNRDCSWQILSDNHFVGDCEVTLDHVWTALQFNQQLPEVIEEPVLEQEENEEVSAQFDEVVMENFAETKRVEVKGVGFTKELIVTPSELEKMFTRHQQAREFFHNLSRSHQEEYVNWIEGAKRESTRVRRLEATVEKLLAGKKSPLEK